MKIVAVTTLVPWPADNGTKRRHGALLQGLGRRDEVHVVVASRDAWNEEAAARLPDATHVPVPRGKVSSLTRMAAPLLRGEPVTPAYVVTAAARRALGDVVRRVRPDAVWAAGLAGAALVRDVVDPGCVVLDLSDAEHARFPALARSLGAVRGAPYRLDAHRAKRWASRWLPRFAAATPVSPGDAEAWAALAPSARLVVVPNGADVRANAARAAGGRRDRVLFVGDLSYPPNAEGVTWFVDGGADRLPGDLRLRVVGRSPDAAPRHPRVDAPGFVPDLDAEWDRALALLVPVRAGGGTAVKVVEALAAGVPVVSTAHGVRGLGLRPGEHYLAGETPPELAEAVARLVREPDLGAALGRAGVEVVRRRLSWESSVTTLREALAATSP